VDALHELWRVQGRSCTRERAFQLLFGLDVRESEPLPPSLLFVRIELPVQSTLDVRGPRVLPFDLVRIVAVHGSQQRTERRTELAGSRLEAVSLGDQRRRLRQQRALRALFGQKRLKSGRRHEKGHYHSVRKRDEN
jgi:hypothetical protein